MEARYPLLLLLLLGSASASDLGVCGCHGNPLRENRRERWTDGALLLLALSTMYADGRLIWWR
jgi:hypothetical protein